MPTAAMVIVVVIPYGLIVVRQPLSIGEAIAMSDEYSLLPYVKAFQFSFAAGEVLGKLYHGGNVVLFTPSQIGQEIMIKSNIPLKNFIDVGSGQYWFISRDYPWIYGTYLVIQKQQQQQQEQRRFINSDPLNNLVANWWERQYVLIRHYHYIYQNPFLAILERK